MAGPRDLRPAAGPRRPASEPRGALRGMTFFNPREAGDAAPLTQALMAQGAQVIERPMIRFVPPASWAPFDKRLAELGPSDWIAFTSATAVRFTLRRLQMLNRAPADLLVARIAAVGKGTAAALEEAALTVTAVPEKEFQGEGLVAAIRPHLRPGDKVWLPRAEEGRDTVADGLRKLNIPVALTSAYRTQPTTEGLGPLEDALRDNKVHWLIFTSPSIAMNFFKLIPAEMQDQVMRGTLEQPAPRVACLGSVTAWAARELGFRVHVVPQQQDVPGLVEAIVTNVVGGPSAQ